MNEPRFRREGGRRDMVLPGNKKFVEGDVLQRSGEGRGKRPPIRVKTTARMHSGSF
jgi:uncharacterized sporulation protein YeaH/YhbH (DUF444 family)